MASKRALARTLATIEGFDDPRVALEQYPTPPELAATLVHLADLREDLNGTVVDLGTGTGILAIGAALRGVPRVVGIDRDRAALVTARANEDRIDPPGAIDWLLGDVAREPLCLGEATVLMNPPFGAQASSAGDRPFLETASRIASVSYSIHNAGSREFVEAFAADEGGTVTDAFGAEFPLHKQFPFHESDRTEIGVEAFRIEWPRRTA